jgi:Ni/Co efflux regulator RcnB
MKTPSIFLTKFLSAAILAAVCLLPEAAEAKDRNKAKGKDRNAGRHQSGDNDRARTVYRSQPRSGFTLSFGTGYAGRGYYYGPPHSAYYYERPEVRYYATREAAPREYYSRGNNNSGGAAVQEVLRRRGYYRGPVDGQIGPQSRRAIARYQEARGLRVTGGISASLLHSLGL